MQIRLQIKKESALTIYLKKILQNVPKGISQNDIYYILATGDEFCSWDSSYLLFPKSEWRGSEMFY